MASSIKLHVLHCGRVRVDRALPFKENTWHPAPFTGWFRKPEYQIWLPVSSYLIEHPKGLVLIDTGWHTDVRIDQIKHMGRFHYSLNKADLPEGQAIHEQLEQRGVRTKDLDYVVFSHLHSDHVSGLKLVSDAKNILVSEPEWRSAHHKDRIRYIPSMWAGVDVNTYKFSPSEYGPQKASFDLFQDGSVLFIHTPGHTAGIVSTLIQTNNKAVLLYGDVGYARKSWEEMIPPGTAVNEKQAVESLKWVGYMSRQPICIESVASHEAEVVPHTIELK